MTQAYPLKWPDGWPRARSRTWGSFSRNLTSGGAFRGLLDELRRLGASGVVISSNIKPRNVGMEDDASAQRDPGVAIYFTLNGRAMTMAQDGFDRVSKNARSLTLAVDAMRAIERHGGGTMMQRAFDGFAALPPPTGGQTYQKKPWRDVLDMPAEAYGALPKDAQAAVAETRYKKLARSAHPDQQDGSAELMAELNLAIEDARQELTQ